MQAVAGFVKDLPDLLSHMIVFLQRGAFEELADLGHNLKGSSGLAGYPDLAAKAGQIQIGADGRRADELAGKIAEVSELCRLVGASVNTADCDSLLGKVAGSELNSGSARVLKADAQDGRESVEKPSKGTKRQERGRNA